ncbi:DUF2145 domain-containing protein [Acidovorax sp. NCPPB 4044]|uniref:DUF2145 domain-containing protein n=1 Tax=Acidovorax sp. NCPPB 4044 TaxID=2940490 RepID=UPI002302E1AF|nr:DUF2145 domain-containing protein [Acidovorax sp. NCPPB 4044]MDA8521551.1 DUF2145 domain-containing protein [Acidovorax sp. NCPPB 4044]
MAGARCLRPALRRAALLALAAGALFGGTAGARPAHAGTWGLCDRPPEAGAAEQDRRLRFAAAVQQALDDSGQTVALIARSGMDLGRFGVLYSHAGIALRSPETGRWSVRQLYYACDAARPRIYDQGLPGFVLGADGVRAGHVAVVLLPGAADAALERVARDRGTALSLLAQDYSANAHAFSTRYQNCNQWVAEMLARAWAPWDGGDGAGPPRAQAQRWLRAQGYAPQPLPAGSHALMFAAHFAPLVHVDDHPLQDLQALRWRTSLPRDIEAFARRQVPGAQRIGLCHDTRQAVVHRGWAPDRPGQATDPGCAAAGGDTVVALDR